MIMIGNVIISFWWILLRFVAILRVSKVSLMFSMIIYSLILSLHWRIESVFPLQWSLEKWECIKKWKSWKNHIIFFRLIILRELFSLALITRAYCTALIPYYNIIYIVLKSGYCKQICKFICNLNKSKTNQFHLKNKWMKVQFPLTIFNETHNPQQFPLTSKLWYGAWMLECLHAARWRIQHLSTPSFT